MKELTFKNHSVVPFDNGDGKIWFTSANMAELLEYADEKSVNRLYNRNKDEFSAEMTRVVTVTSRNKNNKLQYNRARIFSTRGAHLLGMLAETKVAKSLRRWLLDLIEKETQPNLSLLDMGSLRDLAVGEMQNRVFRVNEWSLETFGRPGSSRMTIRKGHLKKIRAVQKVIAELSQVQIPDLGQLSRWRTCMTPIQFIEKNVISELVKQGFDNTVARISADRAVEHYRRSASASAKGKMFDDCLYIAKAWAKKYQLRKSST